MIFFFNLSIRHLFSKHSFSFIYISSILSCLGLMVGISSLIIISCITDGFSSIVNNKLSTIDGNMRITSMFGKISNDDIMHLDSILYNYDNKIDSHTPYIEEYAILRNKGISESVIVYGVKSESLNDIFKFNDLNILDFSDNNLIVGSQLAKNLNLDLGDPVLMFNPKMISEKKMFKITKFNISNTFNTGFPEYDRLLIFMPYETAQEYFNFNNYSSGIFINVAENKDVSILKKEIQSRIFNLDFYITTWKERHSSLLDWLNIYDVPIKLIMYFITLVAIVNIGSTLWMIIIEKRKDYGILSSIGFSRTNLKIIVTIEGIVLGAIGSSLAVILSLMLLLLESKFQFIKLPSDVYFMSSLPIKMNIKYFIFYPFVAISFTSLLSYLTATKYLKSSTAELLSSE